MEQCERMNPILTDTLPPLKTLNEFLWGRPRWKFVVSAAKALIASMDLPLRWLVVQAGADEFIRIARAKFQAHEPGIRFTEDELRWMLAAVTISLPPRFREALRAAEIERFVRKAMTEKDLKAGSTGEDPTGHDGPTQDMGDGVIVETVPDRDKKPIEVLQ